jgi:hypothetical protein
MSDPYFFIETTAMLLEIAIALSVLFILAAPPEH